MALSSSQKTGVKIALVSFAALVSLMIAYETYHWSVPLVVIAGAVLLLIALWGFAMAISPPDESPSLEFSRSVAALGGFYVRSEEDIQAAEERKRAIDPDDRERIDKL